MLKKLKSFSSYMSNPYRQHHQRQQCLPLLLLPLPESRPTATSSAKNSWSTSRAFQKYTNTMTGRRINQNGKNGPANTTSHRRWTSKNAAYKKTATLAISTRRCSKPGDTISAKRHPSPRRQPITHPPTTTILPQTPHRRHPPPPPPSAVHISQCQSNAFNSWTNISNAQRPPPHLPPHLPPHPPPHLPLYSNHPFVMTISTRTK